MRQDRLEPRANKRSATENLGSRLQFGRRPTVLEEQLGCILYSSELIHARRPALPRRRFDMACSCYSIADHQCFQVTTRESRSAVLSVVIGLLPYNLAHSLAEVASALGTRNGRSNRVCPVDCTTAAMQSPISDLSATKHSNDQRFAYRLCTAGTSCNAVHNARLDRRRDKGSTPRCDRGGPPRHISSATVHCWRVSNVPLHASDSSCQSCNPVPACRQLL